MAQGLLSMNAWHDALAVLREEGAWQKGRLPGCASENIEYPAKPQDVEADSAANIGECSSNRARASGEHDRTGKVIYGCEKHLYHRPQV